MSIEIINVSKSFGKKSVLDDVSFKIHEKEILGLIGPSGAGKTTLIRMIIGSLKPSQGIIKMSSIAVPNKALFKKFGFMPQGEALYSDLSGIDNLRFFGRLYGMKGVGLEERCQELLDLMDLNIHRDKLVDKYSGGMKKRLSLIIAMLHNPDYLILDEPTVGIDPALRHRIWKEFEKLTKSGKTIIVSTHVMDEANRCNKVSLIKNGRVLAYGNVDKLREKAKERNLENLFFAEGRNE